MAMHCQSSLSSQVDRRRFLHLLTAGAALTAAAPLFAASGDQASGEQSSRETTSGYRLVAATDRARIMKAAALAMAAEPATITAFPSDKNPGGLHDYFSQADYFWPDPAHPGGKYINRDGQSNPDNFQGHRRAMIALSQRMPALTAAWLLTGDRRYADRACDHLRAWFIAPATRMNANLEFSQGVVGVATGRSYGIIDTLHLVEVARAASLVAPKTLSTIEFIALKDWFRSYLAWMQTSEKGIAERDALNNHATCWALQASEFARLTGAAATREDLLHRFRDILIAKQMGLDGSFPQELARTKPYSYSIFNFDTLAALAQSLKDKHTDPVALRMPDGRGVCKAAEFLYSYLKDKSTWPYAKDVEHFDALPVRSPGLLFAGLACAEPKYLVLWKTLDPDPTDPEIIRNYPIRQPLLWV